MINVHSAVFYLNVGNFICYRALASQLSFLLFQLRDGKVVDYIVGFTDLGNTDDFPTVVLEWRIATQQLINYDGDLMTRPENGQIAPLKTKALLAQSLREKKKNLRGPSDGDSSDENDW